jgi:hypothetical protein
MSTSTTRGRATRALPFLVTLLALALAGSAFAVTAQHGRSAPRPVPRASTARPSAYVPPIKHLFVVVIENKDYDRAWGDGSEAPYLAKTLRSKGVLLNSYYGTAHNSLGNYIAMISGQGPTPEIQADCQFFRDWTGSGTVAPQQYVGQGCVFPKETRTLADQMSEHELTWRGYMQDMGTPCRHPALDAQDDTQQAEVGDQYATRHNPFMYFHSIIDRASWCKKHDVDLTHLRADLAQRSTTRNLSFIVPDLCSDGHDEPCVDDRPGGLASIDAWMKRWVPRILKSPAFRRDGALVITSDESDGPQSDSSACCGEVAGPNSPMPGITGMGGGKIGALVISRWTQPGSWSTTPYNHYSLLASIEETFGLGKLGFARQAGLNRFGLDVWNRYRR